MPVDGKHNQPITAPISNQQGQGSTPIHHLSSFDVPVISCCLITGGSSVDLSVQSEGKGRSVCCEPCFTLTHTHMHAHKYTHAHRSTSAFKCLIENGDVIKCWLSSFNEGQSSCKTVWDTHKNTHTDSNARLSEVMSWKEAHLFWQQPYRRKCIFLKSPNPLLSPLRGQRSRCHSGSILQTACV